MTDTPHIMIIGAGLVGLCTADALARRGAQVSVIDDRSGPCEGTSFSNSGMIHPSQARSWIAPQDDTEIQARQDATRVTLALGAQSKVLLDEQIKRLSLPVRAAGCLQIQPDMATARRVQAAQNANGVKTNIVIDPVQSFGRPACHFPDDSSGDAQAFGCALAADLNVRGVRFLYNAKGLDARKTSDGFSIRAAGQILSSDQLVVAAGVGSPDVLSLLDVRMKLMLVSGAAADFALPEKMDDVPDCPVMDAVSHSAFTPFSDRLRISGGLGVADPAVLISRWSEIAPHLFDRLNNPISTWTSKRPMSPVGRPYISETSVQGLWVNTGHGHMGWTLCAGSGELLAEMMVDGKDDRRFAFAG